MITYDLRGHGRSTLDPPDAGTVHDDVGDLVALVDHLGAAPVSLAAISSGACITLRAAAWHPELVHRLVAHEPPYTAILEDDPEAKPILDEFDEALAGVQQRLEEGDHRGAAERFVDMAIGPGIWATSPGEVKDAWVRHARAFLGQLRDPDATIVDVDRLRPHAESILLSEGSESPAFYPRLLDRLADELPGVDRHTYHGAGHVPHRSHPEEFASVITEFVSGP